MSLPAYKIETYTGAQLDHTITEKAIAIYFKDVVTDGIGHFSFTVATKRDGDTYYYTDIAKNDIVKIWLDWDSVSGNPDFIGKVDKIVASLSKQAGYLRTISGFSQGNVLLNRFKRDKLWEDIGASTIVTELANDLNLGVDSTKLVLDSTAVTLEVETKTYFDLLRQISDYWVNADTQLKKDFYVDFNNDLVWKNRPFRTSGVESFIVGQNIIDHRVIYPTKPVKNDITIYGARERTEPADVDLWTDSLTNWTMVIGTELLLNTTIKRMGSYSVACQQTDAAVKTVDFYKTFPKLKNYGKLVFWAYPVAIGPWTKYARILAPDTSNYFQADITPFTGDTWDIHEYNLGPNYIYDVDSNPTGVWAKVGSPRWYNMQGVEFYLKSDSVPMSLRIDGAFVFSLGRFSGTASDAASKTAYGQRDHEDTDDRLHSDSDCTKRAQTILYQKKDPPIQIEVPVKGNSNILVGDRVPVTIPSEGINIANYDIYAVENYFTTPNKYLTTAFMVNTVNIREPLENDQLRAIVNLRRLVRTLDLEKRKLQI